MKKPFKPIGCRLFVYSHLFACIFYGLIVYLIHNFVNHSLAHDLVNGMVLFVAPVFFATFFYPRYIYFTTLFITAVAILLTQMVIVVLDPSDYFMICIVSGIILIISEILYRVFSWVKRLEEEQNQLRFAALEASSQAKSEFLANMSHEIRTPLNGVIGMAQLLKETPLNTQQKKYIGTIHQSCESLLVIISDILDFSKIEARKMQFDIKKVDLQTLISSICNAMEPFAEDNQVTLTYECPPHVPSNVMTDSVRLQQILTNLVSNAIKFSKGGSVRISVNYKETDTQSGMYTFTVNDNGIGIPKDKQESIFNIFTQVDTSTTRSYGGTGLGLAIVKGLVDMMDGTVGVESQPGKGSTFRISLPLKLDQSHSKQEFIPLPEKPALIQQQNEILKDKPVLLVEDNPINQKVIQAFLESIGAIVDIANDGKEGAAMYQQQKYTMVLMDIQMPIMDGYESTKQIRTYESEQGTYTPIIAVTAHSMVGEKEKCIDAGMDNYISKPVNFELLIQMIHSYI